MNGNDNLKDLLSAVFGDSKGFDDYFSKKTKKETIKKDTRTPIVPMKKGTNDGTNLYLTFSLPGFTKEHIKVQVNGRVLIVTAIRGTQNETFYYEEKFSIKASVHTNSISAEMKNGTLTIKMPYEKSHREDFEVTIR